LQSERRFKILLNKILIYPDYSRVEVAADSVARREATAVILVKQKIEIATLPRSLTMTSLCLKLPRANRLLAIIILFRKKRSADFLNISG